MELGAQDLRSSLPRASGGVSVSMTLWAEGKPFPVRAVVVISNLIAFFMRKIFFRVTKDLFPQVKDRFPFVYLEHGRIEIDDSSVKWIDKNCLVVRIPVAVIGSIFLGPGTSITHEAVKCIGEAGCTICWVGSESLHFYAYGLPPTANTQNLYKQIRLASMEETKTNVARRMFQKRFGSVDLSAKSLPVMMGMEGNRVRSLYAAFAEKYGVEWKGRSYVPGESGKSDPVNRVLTFANSLLYGLVTSSVLAMGYSPRVGFIHSGSPLPFVYDVSDLYKEKLTIELSFEMVARGEDIYDRHRIIEKFAEKVVDYGLMECMPIDVAEVMSDSRDC